MTTVDRSGRRLAVLLSGSGRTLTNLHDAINSGALDATVGLVIASRPCLGATRAEQMGLPTRIIPGRIDADVLGSLLDEHRIDLVVLAGYLQLVEVPKTYQWRVVNIHPALLPDFGGPGMYGDRVHRAVLGAGVNESGCTVHLCDEAYDRGPILLQRRCEVRPDDTPDRLGERVFAEECRAYPDAISMLLDGRVRVEGGTVRIDP